MPQKPKVTGLKLTGLTVPLFPDKEAEIREYGAELARYLNFELDEDQQMRFDKGATIKPGRWLSYSYGAADMLRRWASKLPRTVATDAPGNCKANGSYPAPGRENLGSSSWASN